MAEISMGKLSVAYLSGQKTITRRDWKKRHADKFKPGTIHIVTNKQKRFGGKQIGTLQVRRIDWEALNRMTEVDYVLEGFAYLERIGQDYEGMHPRDFFNEWRKSNEMRYKLTYRKL